MSTTSTKQSAQEKATQRGLREGSTMWAAVEVLRGKRKPMTAAEICAEIGERELAPGLKGKTPEQTLAAQLAVNAKRGRKPLLPGPDYVWLGPSSLHISPWTSRGLRSRCGHLRASQPVLRGPHELSSDILAGHRFGVSGPDAARL